jgi:integrase
VRRNKSGLPIYCGFNYDHHGKRRVRFRKGGFTTYLTGIPWSEPFMRDYATALEGQKAQANNIGADQTLPNTLGALVKAYLDPASTSLFKTRAAETRRTQRNILENFAEEYGHKPLYRTDRNGRQIMLLMPEYMQAIVNGKALTPFAQRNFLNTVGVMFRWAKREGRIPFDPTAGVTREKVKTSGYPSWSESETQRFEQHYPVGSKPRLAFGLLLYTGQRRGDVVKLGRHHIQPDPQWEHGALVLDQEKTKGGEEAHVEIPVHPKLHEIIEATPTVGVKTFLVTHFGKPYTAPGFGNWFRELCDAARCHGVSAHGLRKATARRLAEIGCTEHQIAAITGHATLKEVQRYTRAADRKRLGREAMTKLIEGGW